MGKQPSRMERGWLDLDWKMSEAREVASSHPDPRCDKRADDDPIECGWKAAYTEMLEALEPG